MTKLNLREFMRQNLGMPLVDATRVLPQNMLERVERGGRRLALVQDGMVVSAIVPTRDLELLEITDPGVSLVSDEALQIS